MLKILTRPSPASENQYAIYMKKLFAAVYLDVPKRKAQSLKAQSTHGVLGRVVNNNYQLFFFYIPHSKFVI